MRNHLLLVYLFSNEFLFLEFFNIKQELNNTTRGFSCFRFIPGRQDEILAIKSEEVGTKTASCILFYFIFFVLIIFYFLKLYIIIYFVYLNYFRYNDF